MTIDKTSYGVQWNKQQRSIGRTATHGCIRLYNDQMERLYGAYSRSGDRCFLSNEPAKGKGVLNNGIYVEAHPDIYGRVPDRTAYELHRPGELGLLSSVRDLPSSGARDREEARGSTVRVWTLPTRTRS